MVDKKLVTLHVPGKAPDLVIHGDNIRIKGANQIIQGRKRRNLPTSSHIDIHTEGGQTGLGMIFRIGMYRDMALVQMCHRSVSHRYHAVLCDQNGDRASLGLIVLAGNIQHLGADHVRDVGQNIGQTLGVILFVNVCNVVLLLPLALGIAYIIDIKA